MWLICIHRQAVSIAKGVVTSAGMVLQAWVMSEPAARFLVDHSTRRVWKKEQVAQDSIATACNTAIVMSDAAHASCSSRTVCHAWELHHGLHISVQVVCTKICTAFYCMGQLQSYRCSRSLPIKHMCTNYLTNDASSVTARLLLPDYRSSPSY